MSPAYITYDMTSQSTGNVISVPKLRDNGSNWVDYEAKVRSALGAKGALRHVEGTVIEPIPYVIEDGVYVVEPGKEATDEQVEAREKRIDEYIQRENTAMHILLTSVSPRVASLIRSHSAADMWNKIKDDAINKSEIHRTQVKRKLHQLKFDDTIGGMRSHLNSLTETRDELLGMGISVDDFASIIINSMPESYHNLVSAISGASRTAGGEIDSDNLIVLLTEEDDYRKSEQKSKKSKGDNQALNVNKGKGPRKSDAKCDNCGRKGHTAPNCFQPGGGKEGQAPWQKTQDKDQQKAAKATDSKSKPDDKKTGGSYAFTVFGHSHPHVLTAATQKADAAVDSGATVHYCPDRAKFVTYQTVSGPEIYAADGRALRSIGMGNIVINLPNGDESTEVTLRDVFHVPEMTTTLISVGRLDAAGYLAHFGRGMCRIEAPDNKIIAQVPLQHGLYALGARSPNSDVALSAIQKLTLAQAHKTLGHINCRAILDGIRLGNIVGIELADTEEVFCEACAQAKPHRKPFPQQAENRAENFGDLIHMDLWGPASVESINHKRYTLDFKDDATRWTDIDYLATKDLSLKSYQTFEKSLEVQHGVVIKALRCDRAGEFSSREFEEHLKAKGTKREFTVHDTHEQVGVVERFNRTKLELARAMLFDSGLPMFLWAEATNHARWITNRSPTRALDGKSPFESRFKKKPDMRKLVPFGTRAWVKIHNAGKLERRAKLGFFVGYDDESTGFRIYYPERRTVGVEREVTFDVSPRETIEVPLDDIPVFRPNGSPAEKDGNVPVAGEEKADREIRDEPRLDGEIEGEPENREAEELPEETEGRSMRSRGANAEPGHYWNLAGKPRRGQRANMLIGVEDTLFALSSALETAPDTIAEALAGPNAEEWRKSWKAELDQLQNIGVWKLVPRPKDKPVIPCREVLHEKHAADGTVSRRKVRIAAGGHRQIENVNYTDTFASAAKIATIRIVLALAAKWDWELDQVDVVAAFLNGILKEEVYMEAPYGVLAKNDRSMVCQLLQTLYGLKQAGNEWYKEMSRVFKLMGFKVSLCDSSLFIRFNEQGGLIIPVSTDDMAIAGSSRELVDNFKAELSKYFKITDEGELHWLLGFEVKRNREKRTIALNQKSYIEAMAKKFGQDTARPTYTPLEPGTVLSKDQCPDVPIDEPYQVASGHVLWPALITRPDVQCPVGLTAQFAQNPATEHWRAVMRIIRYLYTTRDYWLVLGGEGDVGVGYVDADWASQMDRHSISGYCFHIGQGAVTWSSKRQSIVALSTTEAEYIAGVHAAKEAEWLRQLFAELQVDRRGPMILRCDNQSAIALCKDSKFHARTKHMDIRYHHIREQVADGRLNVLYIPSTSNPADIFTKALPRKSHEVFVAKLGLREL
jgi:hypothetical protein